MTGTSARLQLAALTDDDLSRLRDVDPGGFDDLEHHARPGLFAQACHGVKRMPAGAMLGIGAAATKTVSSSGKCVKTWRTGMGSLRQLAATGAS